MSLIKSNTTLHLLSTNILQYVLNEYLNWNTDIRKIHKVTKIKFNIKPHIITRYNYYTENIVKWIQVYIDNQIFSLNHFDIGGNKIYKKEYRFNKVINEQRFVGNDVKISENHLKNGKLYGKSYAWNINGEIIRISNFYNDMFHGYQVYYCEGKLVEIKEYRYGKILMWKRVC